MLKPFIPSKFVERIITSQTGECYRVVFVVSLVNGEVKAKVISAELISAPTLKLAPVYSNTSGDSGASNSSDFSNVDLGVLCLPCDSSLISSFATFISSFAPKVSPFTSLLFFTSQPTRAPSGKF